jgi:hypothetical protein
MLQHVIKPIMLLAGLLLWSPAFTQTTDGASDAVLQSCLLGTTMETWVALELTPDQTRRVQHIQEACKDECELVGATPTSTTISGANGSTIMAELKNVLTKEQFHAWKEHCSRP